MDQWLRCSRWLFCRRVCANETGRRWNSVGIDRVCILIYLLTRPEHVDFHSLAAALQIAVTLRRNDTRSPVIILFVLLCQQSFWLMDTLIAWSFVNLALSKSTRTSEFSLTLDRPQFVLLESAQIFGHLSGTLRLQLRLYVTPFATQPLQIEYH